MPISKRMSIKYIDEVRFCCKKMREYYESHEDIKLDGDSGTMTYENEIIDECPFCGTTIEVEVSLCHWGGEE